MTRTKRAEQRAGRHVGQAVRAGGTATVAGSGAPMSSDQGAPTGPSADVAASGDDEPMPVFGSFGHPRSRPGPASEGEDGAPNSDPWARFGWVMATIWLVFLAFPVLSIVNSGASLLVQVLSIVAIAAFAAVYITAFLRLSHTETTQQATRVGVVHMALMVLLVAAVIPVLSAWVLGLVVFLVALAVFSLPLVWAAVVTVASILLAFLWPLAIGMLEEMWFFIPIITMVGVGNGVVQVLGQRQATYLAMEDERQLAAERDRVARDVHDVLGHSLTVITVKAELAERLIDADPQQAKAELAQIQTLSRESLAEVRATVAGLRVARLEDEVQRARTALAGAGIQAELPTDITTVDPRHRIVLAWVLRELVTNVVRHSAATTCRIRLGPSWLQVIDDGVGIGDGAAGHGLRGVAERIGCGELTITAGARGRGATVTVTLDAEEQPPGYGSEAATDPVETDRG